MRPIIDKMKEKLHKLYVHQVKFLSALVIKELRKKILFIGLIIVSLVILILLLAIPALYNILYAVLIAILMAIPIDFFKGKIIEALKYIFDNIKWKLYEKSRIINVIMDHNESFYSNYVLPQLKRNNYVEREYDERILREIIKNGKKLILVIGRSGIGKTLLSLNLFRNIMKMRDRKILPAFIDLKENFYTLPKKFLSDIILTKISREYMLVILIDSVDTINFNIYKNIIRMLERYKNIRVISCIESIEYVHILSENKYSRLFFRKFEIIEIKPLNNREIAKFVKRRGIVIREEDIPPNIPEFLRIPKILDMYIQLLPFKKVRREPFSQKVLSYYNHHAKLYMELYEKALRETGGRINGLLEYIIAYKERLIPSIIILHYMTNDDVLKLVRDYLLVEMRVDNHRYYKFTHESICASFSALYLYGKSLNEKITYVSDFLRAENTFCNNILRWLFVVLLNIGRTNEIRSLVKTIRKSVGEEIILKLNTILLDTYNESFRYGYKIKNEDIDILKSVLGQLSSFYYFIDLIVQEKWSIFGHCLMKILTNNMYTYERKRRLCEILPMLFSYDQDITISLMKILRLDFHDRFKSDIRRRVLEAIDIILSRSRIKGEISKDKEDLFQEFLKVVYNSHGPDEPFTLFAMVELVLSHYPHIWSRIKDEINTYIEKFNTIRDKYFRTKRTYILFDKKDLKESFVFLEKLVKSFVSGNLDDIEQLLTDNLRSHNILVKICIARNLWRVLDSRKLLSFYRKLLLDIEKNVRRPLVMERNIDRLMSIYRESYDLRKTIHEIIEKLSGDEDDLIRITLLDNIGMFILLKKDFTISLIEKWLQRERNDLIKKRLKLIREYIA